MRVIKKFSTRGTEMLLYYCQPHFGKQTGFQWVVCSKFGARFPPPTLIAELVSQLEHTNL
jgi:hypothetical protein